jgi:hypothetical protein
VGHPTPEAKPRISHLLEPYKGSSIFFMAPNITCSSGQGGVCVCKTNNIKLVSITFITMGDVMIKTKIISMVEAPSVSMNTVMRAGTRTTIDILGL